MVDKRSIQFDLDDPRSGKIANVMSSKTAKKILHVLADGEKSSSEIAEELGMPLNTVSYNLKKLVNAGLVDKSKRFFWSSKGKRIEFYKLSNRKIIISPKVMARKTVVMVAGVLIGLVAVLAILSMQGQLSEEPYDNQLKKFNSLDEIKSFVSESDRDFYGSFGDNVRSFAQAESSVANDASAAKAEEYSTTNIQVEGVDEPDIVKNDGKYIYVVTRGNVAIVEAFPAEGMEVLSEINLSDEVSEIFINGDKLILFSQGYEYVDTGIKCVNVHANMETGVFRRCGGYGDYKTFVRTYDVSDRADPVLEDEIVVDGWYRDARMIDNFVYVVSSKAVYLNAFGLPSYVVNGVEKTVSPSEIYYFDSPDRSYVFNSISAINLNNGDVNTKIYLMGFSTNLYVSQDNIYLSYHKQVSYDNFVDGLAEEVMLPILPEEYHNEIYDILESEDSYNRKMNDMRKVVYDYANTLEGPEKYAISRELADKLGEFHIKIYKETEKTVIHKIGINGLDINYEANGEVPGRILDQFSMDEFDGKFRVATTLGDGRRSLSLNNLYVLDKNLKIIGSVEDLAPGERIYSARFMGKRAYLVTFRQVDPLYVIDLSNVKNPEVLGYLKVTGFSDYLHPYDETHIIGIGKEADENGRIRGVKISLFDVSDVENPVEIDKYEIAEGKWSQSEALNDHKAFLFDRERELLVIPVSYAKKINSSGASVMWDYEYWQGAFVFNINLEDGINLKGKITHGQNQSNDSYWHGGDYVKRALYMDDILYTISNKIIKANDLFDLNEISFVELPYEEPNEPVYFAE
jgi:uncharacterized secreted protein with C-terminal beta-propeller domain